MSKNEKLNYAVIGDRSVYSAEIAKCLDAFKSMGASVEDLDIEFEKMMTSPTYLAECLAYLTKVENVIH